MAYLVRRLLENTSNESWLRGKFAEGKTTAELLRDPVETLANQSVGTHSTSGPSGAGRGPGEAANLRRGFEFNNEPLTDFAIPENREKFKTALTRFKFQKEIKPIIGGSEIQTESILKRENPSQKNQIVSQVYMANEALTEKAVTLAHQGWKAWKTTPPETRALLLEKLADLMTVRKFDLCATQVFEVGKPWAEADGDVAEAIDFCRYYARHMKLLSIPQRVGGVPGEISEYYYQSRGSPL
jgi:RHH-type proline utilization regulon transcriptional repressor/proline dehydrogenase/delta 1-pyrroline-5-carboxylate dehydrogenase